MLTVYQTLTDLQTRNDEVMKSIKYILFLLLISNSILGQPVCPITTNNIRVCPNTNAQLNVSGAQFYSWTPSAGLSDSTSANPTVNVPITTNYFVTGFNESSSNLIVNGDFTSGNSGFTSNYTYTTTDLHPEGYYAVGKNPKSLHSDFSACGDHTTGTGKMLIVNGNVVPNIKVWGQPITVKANTYYAFYAYVTPVHPTNPPVLQFSINGSVIGAPFTSSNATCTWQKFYAVWYSGSITNANISIVNQNTIANGNDFALDDIKFVELCTATNKVTVTVGPLTSITNISTCTTNLPYNWNGSDYNASGTYTKHLSSVLGCDSIATLNLKVNVPTSSITSASICQGSSYLFNGTSYSTAGTYSKTLINAAGCDSIATLNLTVNVPTSSTTNGSICQGGSYLFNGTSYSTTGTYTKTLINAAGCDSIATLNLTVNVPTSSTTNASICQGGSYLFNGTSYSTTGTYTKTLINAAGCDSIATLNLTVNVPTSSTTNASICQGGSYTFNSLTYNVAGTYTKTLINAAGCDSVATLNLKVNVPTSSTTNASICQGGSYLFNGTSYNTTGTYTKILINAAGCDSTATLNLTVNVPTSSITNASICQGGSYTFNGSTYTVAGTYSKTFTNTAGCDSIAILNLTVNIPTSSITNASICQGGSYTFNGSTYMVAGTYTKTLINAAGCDSIATLNLTVNVPTSSTTNASICQGGYYTFNGSTYMVAGTYTKTLINAAGCDSISTLNLTVNVPTSSTTNASICQGGSYTFNGSTYNVAGTYTKILTNAAGCDSVATLNLKVNVPTSSTTNASICQGGSYTFNGSTYNVAGTYTKTLINAAGCDSIANLNLIVNIPTSSTTNARICQGGSYLFNGTSYNTTGTYTKTLTNAAGCDSIATLNLTVNVPTSSTTNASICQGGSYTFNGSTYNVAGTYTKILTNATGCDSIATLNLTVNVPTSSTTNASICQGGSYLFNGTSYNTTGTYTKTLMNAAGCDSIATLNLTVNVPTTSTTNASICQGGSYTFNGSTYNVAGTYTKILTNAAGCDSIATLNLTVNVPTTSTTNASICQGGSYLFNGTTYSTAGTYSKTLINVVGCDSVATLNLTVNVPTSSTTNAIICQGGSYLFNGTSYSTTGTYTKNLINATGCDSIATLNLTVNVPTSSTINASICQGSSYTFNGSTYTVAGTYTKTLINAFGCDSIATLNLTVNVPTSSTTNASICQGGSYTFNGSTYMVAGTYTKTLINAAGCDSISTLNLTVNVPTSSTTNASICRGGSYTFNGSTYNVAGTYTKTLINAVGCDSIATLNLTVNIPTSSTINASICQGSSYTFNGSTYNVAGIYSKTLTNAAGCDSVATLNLTVNVPTASTTNASICQGGSYLFNGTSYNTTGTYTKTLINAAGCDSIATLNLTVNVPTSSTTNASICQGGSYTFNGSTYTVAGTYTKTLINAFGCDSIATLNLTVNVPTSSTTNASICQGGSYTFNGSTYMVAGTYTKTLINAAGCDSISTLDLTVNVPTSSTTNASICQGGSYTFNGSTYTVAGKYSKTFTNTAGCDSIATLNLTVNVPTSSTTKAIICQGGSYLFNGTSYNTTGTYTKILINAAGCDSIATLNLTVNVPTTSTTNVGICQGGSYLFNGTSYNTTGIYSKTLINVAGCDSIATLNLTVNVPTSSTTNASICQGGSYLFNGTSYNTTGTYTKTLINAAGCDSIAILNLTVNIPTSSTTNASICQGGSYLFNGSTYTVAGTYTKTLTNTAGCDSIATLNLTVNVSTSSTTNASICQGSSYLFARTSYNTTGTYTKTLINAAGCDSIVTLNLTVNVPTSSITNASICQGGSYIFNGSTYTIAGTYTKTLTNAAGCDSIATLNLTVNIPTSSTTNASICQGGSYLFNGASYNTTGTYTKTLINAAGCDSIATLNLTVNVPTTSTTNASICQGSSYLFNGISYSTAGTYSKTLTNAAGCDSIATLNLTVNVPTSSTTNAGICLGGSYLFNGTSYSTTGTYTKNLINVTGCDSIAILNLTVKSSSTSTTSVSICQGEKYSFNGSTCIVTGTYVAYLTNSVGCDSIATLHLTVNMPTSSTIESSISEEDIKMFGGYKFNGTVYHQVGTYTVKLVNATGCDSITTLVLKARAQTTQATKVTVCSSELPYLWNGTSYNVTGIFTKTLKNSLGVDSIATLDITVLNSTSSVTKATVCSGNTYYFNGSSYSTAGAYVAKLNNSAGCDSIATLELAVDTVYNTSQTVQLFTGEKFTVNGHVYDQPGTYTDIVTSVNNCESTTITKITMVDLPNAFTPNGDGVNDEFMKDWHVQIYNRNGILLFEGNDGWDGKYNGKPVTKDTYFFILYYLHDSKTKSKEGYVMLIR